jgi:hypothetical protein
MIFPNIFFGPIKYRMTLPVIESPGIEIAAIFLRRELSES